MGILSGVRERRDFGTAGLMIPANSQQSSSGRGLGGNELALTLSTVWACVRLRAELVSTFPIEVWATRTGEDGIDRLITRPTPKVLSKPGGERVDIVEWLYGSTVSLDMRGNFFGHIVARDANGIPTQIESLDPDFVNVYLDDAGAIQYRVNGRKVADPATIWHERQNVWPGSVVGMSTISYAARSMGISIAAERFGSDWFRDGAHPSSVLMSDQPIDESQAKTIKTKVLAALRGNREPLVLGAGLKYAAMQVSPDESQFLATLEHGERAACRFFNVDPELVGVTASGSSVTYANREQRMLDFLALRLNPTLVRRETSLSKLCPGGNRARFTTDTILRSDHKTETEVHVLRIAGKIEAPSEARAFMELPPATAPQLAEMELVPLTVSPTGKPTKVPPPSTAPAAVAPPVDDTAQLAAPEVHMHFGDIRPEVNVLIPATAARRQVIERDPATGDILALTMD